MGIIKSTINKANRILSDRRSIRKYDETVKISRSELESIIQDAMTAPSSFNLQPWRFVVIDTPEAKEKVKPYMMFNLQQLETSSAIIAVYADKKVAETADQVLSQGVEKGLRTEEQKQQLKDMILSYISSYTPERLANSLMMDCGFVCIQLMLSAKACGYDTCPIGGYDRQGFSDAVGMDTERYMPALLISIGKAAEDGKASTRYSVDAVTKWM